MVSDIAKEVNIELTKEEILFQETNKELKQLHQIITKYDEAAKLLEKVTFVTLKVTAAKNLIQTHLEPEITTQVDIVLQQLGVEFDKHMHPDFPDEWLGSVSRVESELKGISANAKAIQAKVPEMIQRNFFSDAVVYLKHLLQSCRDAQVHLDFEERQLQSLTQNMYRLHANVYLKKNEELIRSWWTKIVNDKLIAVAKPRLTTSSNVDIKKDGYSYHGCKTDYIKLILYYSQTRSGTEAFTIDYIPGSDQFEAIGPFGRVESQSLATLLEKVADAVRRSYQRR